METGGDAEGRNGGRCGNLGRGSGGTDLTSAEHPKSAFLRPLCPSFDGSFQ